MEEQQFDPYKFIGIILIALILTWMLFRTENSNISNPNITESVDVSETKSSPKINEFNNSSQNDEINQTYGIFSKWLEPKENEDLVLENKNLKIKISSKGANLTLVNLKDFSNHLEKPLNLVSENNHLINTSLKSRLGLLIDTKNIYFNNIKNEKNKGSQSIIFRANISDYKFLEFRYTLPNDGYKLGFEIRSEGLENILADEDVILSWQTNLFRNSKSIDYESRYTQLTYSYEEDKVDNLSLSGEDEEIENKVRWISYRQHFFSSILIPDILMDEVSLNQKILQLTKP